ncbi:MAG: nucleoside triphosphate pyrophosphohydrolase [Bacillota bacterium]|nr:nucleoside triphosphate pyrophosphohydrolase [Bacillota bacterium]
MKKIIIVGLGPGPEKLLTLEAYEILKNAKNLFFRTESHPVVEKLIKSGIKYRSYDSYYDLYDGFDELFESIGDDLINQVNNFEEIIYAVPGNPSMYDDSVRYLFEKSFDDYEIEVIYGASVHEVAFASIDTAITDQFSVINALEIKKHNINYKQNNMIIGVYNQYIASDIKINLLINYELEHKVYFIYRAKTENEYIAKVSLEEIDRLDKYDHLTCIYIPKNEKKKSFSDFVEIMDFLRSEDGCSWDREQTNNSLIPHTIEEVYEVISAIESENYDDFKEELGDLFLQIIFYAQINSEKGYFDIYDVIDSVVKKLIRRHPHIFGGIKKKNNDSNIYWESIKRKEYDEKYIYESMERIPKKLPSLMKSYKIQEKAAKAGFDWNSIDGATEKLDEEINELIEARKTGNVDSIIDELGDVLFSIVNVARFLKIRPEIALESTNRKFISRFKKMERSDISIERGFASLSLEEMEKLWINAKKIK